MLKTNHCAILWVQIIENSSQLPIDDPYWGLPSLRVSLTRGGRIVALTHIKYGIHTPILGLSLEHAISEFHKLYHNAILIIRASIEWTIPDSYYKVILKMKSYLDRSSLVCIAHILDTHHGIHPISSSLKRLEELQPDLVLCTHAQHFHFFSNYSPLFNIPTTKTGFLDFSSLSSNSSQNEQTSKCLLPFKKNLTHMRRQFYSERILSVESTRSSISTQRFSDFNKWFTALPSFRSFIYIPLGNSTGINNLLPCAVQGMPVFSLRLPECTGQKITYELLNLKCSFFTSPDELSALISSPTCHEKRFRFPDIYTKILPSTKKYHLTLLNSEKLSSPFSFRPSFYDYRYSDLSKANSSFTKDEFNSIVLIYEDVQNILECFPRISKIYVRAIQHYSKISSTLKLSLKDLPVSIKAYNEKLDFKDSLVVHLGFDSHDISTILQDSAMHYFPQNPSTDYSIYGNSKISFISIENHFKQLNGSLFSCSKN